MYCNYCGKVIQEDANVCAYCGKQVGAAPAHKRIMRPRSGRQIAGVALAFAEYFDIDVSLIRVIWLLVAIFGGTGILAYVVCWIVIPDESKIKETAVQTASSAAGSAATNSPASGT